MSNTPSELCFLSAIELTAAIREKRTSPVEATQAVLDQIDRLNPRLNCICTPMADEALAAARQAEADVMNGADLGPLHGVPVTVKDILAVAGSRTTFGSRLLADNVTREDCPAVERLRRAGAVLIGRTTTPEFGWKGVTDSPLFGITRNPWNPELTPGGSSGGAAAAVAAGMGPIGLGTDGGGSIRIPAACCGLMGLKPSFGRVPNHPPTAVDSIRHTGPLTRTVADAALALQVMAGPDERDPTSLPRTDTDFLGELDRGIAGRRVAYSADLGHAQVDPEVARLCRGAAERFRELGATVEVLELNWPDPYDCWQTFFYGGIAAANSVHLPDKADLFDPGLLKTIEAGLKLSAVDYVNALMGRAGWWQRVRRIFAQFDLLITPGLAVPPFPVGRNAPDPPAGHIGTHLRWTPFTYLFNMTGQPAATVPCGWLDSGLPVALQIVGHRFDDLKVLQAARAWEQLQPWADKWPSLARGDKND